MNRVGFSSCCFPASVPMEETLAFCLAQGFSAMELELNSTNFNPATAASSTLGRIRDLAMNGTVEFGLHSPGDVNFSDPDESRRRAAKVRVEESLRFAGSLGVTHVVVHPGRVVGEWSEVLWRVALEQNVTALRECADVAREAGVQLCVENLCHERQSVNPDIQSLLGMCIQIGMARVRIALDTNHAGLVDGLEKSVAVVGPYVSHVHFSSNKGQRSDHCTPQEGVMDFKPVASFLQIVPGLLIIELNERGEQSANAVLQTRDFLLDLLQSGLGKAERGRE